MVKHDIEAYLDGSLGQAEKAQFEEEMRRNPDFAKQVATQQKVVQHLRAQLLREHVASVLSEKPRNRPFGWWWLLLAVAVLAVGFGVWGGQQPAKAPVAPAPVIPSAMPDPDSLPSVPSEPVQGSPETTAPEGKAATTKPQPIAGLPASQAPGLRGQNEEDPAWKTKLDKILQANAPPAASSFGPGFRGEAELMAKREFTQAFVSLEMKERKQDKNDTLRFLKGYCLLELKEGADAIRYFEGLERHQPDWKPSLQWYRGLGLVLTGGGEKAIPIFKEISASPSHPYREQAARALEVLK